MASAQKSWAEAAAAGRKATARADRTEILVRDEIFKVIILIGDLSVG
jgi:hypothetical protein